MKARDTMLGLLAILFGATLSARGEGAPTSDVWDCGTMALYHLLHLTGRPSDIDEIKSALPPAAENGRSILELRNAAARCGARFDAVPIPKRYSAIGGPALLFVKNRKDGHCVVVRPVGHTGTLVQVLDGEREPVVLDADRLFRSPSWTGLALVPHRTNYVVPVAASFAAGCLLVVAIRTRRWARVARNSPVATACPNRGSKK